MNERTLLLIFRIVIYVKNQEIKMDNNNNGQTKNIERLARKKTRSQTIEEKCETNHKS